MTDATRTQYAAGAPHASEDGTAVESERRVSVARFVQAAIAGAVVMAALGALAFYLVFPEDLLENYVFPRQPPSPWYQIAAVLSAALFMTAIYVVSGPAQRRPRAATTLGALLGMLASGPAQLALFAMVRSNPWRNLAIICWTTASWAAAGATINRVLTRPAAEPEEEPHAG